MGGNPFAEDDLLGYGWVSGSRLWFGVHRIGFRV